MNPWTPYISNMLIFWRERRGYTFSFIADLMKREFGCNFSKSSCIAKYARLKENGVLVDLDMASEYAGDNGQETKNRINQVEGLEEKTTPIFKHQSLGGRNDR